MKIFKEIPSKKPTTPLLDKISIPADLRSLSINELKTLSNELREFLKEQIHIIFNECGMERTQQFLDDIQGIITNWILKSGFSVGIGDLVPDQSSRDKMKDIINVSCEPLVSVDYIGSSFSAVVDCLSTTVLNKRFLKLLAWYDNEHGYCCRVLDLLDYLTRKPQVVKPLKTKE